MTSHTIGERLNTNYGQKIKSADVGRNGGLDTKSTKNIARIDYANKIMWYGRNWKKENKRESRTVFVAITISVVV